MNAKIQLAGSQPAFVAALTARRSGATANTPECQLDGYVDFGRRAAIQRRAWLPLAVAAALAAAPAEAQDAPPPGRPFGGSIATPVSPTAVLQARLEPAPDSGAVLGYAVVIRGPAGWYRRPTRWNPLPPDSVEADGGVIGEAWEVGERRYSLRYDPAAQRLTLFGRTMDLGASRVVFVTLGEDPADPTTVEQGPPTDFRLAAPPFAPAFLQAFPEARAFAGLPPE